MLRVLFVLPSSHSLLVVGVSGNCSHQLRAFTDYFQRPVRRLDRSALRRSDPICSDRVEKISATLSGADLEILRHPGRKPAAGEAVILLGGPDTNKAVHGRSLRNG